jgi:hypothetical protein
MAKITYKEITPNTTAVFLEGKRVGTIQKRTIDGQFQYWPWGDMQEGGDKFPTLVLCKQSLEAD